MNAILYLHVGLTAGGDAAGMVMVMLKVMLMAMVTRLVQTRLHLPISGVCGVSEDKQRLQRGAPFREFGTDRGFSFYQSFTNGNGMGLCAFLHK